MKPFEKRHSGLDQESYKGEVNKIFNKKKDTEVLIAFHGALRDLKNKLSPGANYYENKQGGKVDKKTEIEILSKLDLMLNNNEEGLAKVKAGIKTVKDTCAKNRVLKNEGKPIVSLGSSDAVSCEWYKTAEEFKEEERRKKEEEEKRARYNEPEPMTYKEAYAKLDDMNWFEFIWNAMSRHS